MSQGDHTIHISVEDVGDSDDVPDSSRLEHFLAFGLNMLKVEPAELSLKITGETISRNFNARYRGTDKPTNILSFSGGTFNFESPSSCKTDQTTIRLLGDMLVCHPVLVKEAAEQDKSLEAHYAHICIHGLLHLLGYNHVEAKEAELMEYKEVEILAAMGFDNPYEQVGLVT